MIDPVDSFIVRETNKTDKLVAAILAAALYCEQSRAFPEPGNGIDPIVDLWARMLTKMKDKKLTTLG